MKKMGDFRRIGVSGCVWEKREMGVFGWSAVGGLIGEGPEVVFRRWGRWWVVVGCVGLGSFGFGEEKDGGAGKGGCTAEGKNEGKRGEK
jgi:hypothetical protein